IAAREGTIQIIDWLLTAGADINVTAEEGITPFLIACSERSPDFLRQLVDRGANPAAKQKQSIEDAGFNALHIAAFDGNHRAIPYLASLKIDVNEIDPATGATPLGLAIAVNCRDCATELLNAGADPKRKDVEGRDAVQLCEANRRNFCGMFLR